VNLWLVAGIVGAVTAVVIALMHAVRRRARKDFFFVEVERGAGAFSFLGTAFAVLLAFVVFEAFDSFNEAKAGAEGEATTLVQLSRTADFFPPAERDPLEGSLICYGRAVIHYDWPTMREGDRSPEVQDWVGRLDEGLMRLHPRTPQQEAAFLQLLEQQDNRVEARRVRLSEANRSLPGPVWFILVLGALLTIGFSLLFADRREAFFVQAALVGAIAALVTSGLLLIWFLDHPYEGRTGSIEPSEMRRQLPLVEDEQKGVAVPCDSSGAPLGPPEAGQT
jgi:hypothetical protein